MIYYQKNHWYIIFITFIFQMKKIWPYIIFLSLQFSNHISIGKAVIICILFILIYSIIRWMNATLILNEDSLIYRDGAIIKDEMIIPIKNISLVELQKNWFYRLFRLSQVKVDSLSKTKNTEVLMILKTKELEKLYIHLSERIKNLSDKESLDINTRLVYRISAIHLILLSMLRNNIILGAGLLYSSIKVMDKLYNGLKEGLKNFLINIIREEVISKDTILAIIFSLMILIAAMIMIVLIFSIVMTLTKYYKFRIYRQNNYLRVEYGLLNRKSYSIPTENIHALKIEQNIINQILNLYTIRCSVVGYGDTVREDELIFPLCGEKLLADILENIIPEFLYMGEIYRPNGRAKRRFYIVPVSLAIIFSLSIYIMHRNIVIGIIITCIVVINRYFACKNTEFGFNDVIFYVSFKGFNRKRIYIRKSSVEEIWMISNPLQLRKKLCNFKIKYYSQKTEDWIKVRNLDRSIYEKIKLKI